MNDSEAAAQQIALSIRMRRLAGEVISDEDVLAEHPELYELLAEQLRRLRSIEEASSSVDRTTQHVLPEIGSNEEPGSSPPDASDTFSGDDQEDDLGDIRMTAVEESEKDVLRQTCLAGRIEADAIPQDPDSATASPDISAPTRIFRPTNRPPMAMIKVYHDGMQSFSFERVMTDRYTFGRTDGDLMIPHDFRVSGRHAEIQRRRDGERYSWHLVDLDSANGTFVRVGRVRLYEGDELLIGKERYRFIQTRGRAGLEHLSQDGDPTWFFSGDSVWIGRQFDGLPCFATDPYLEAKHAFIQAIEGGWMLKDANTLNGVWYRVREIPLVQSCSFQLGEQRFGFLLC